MNDGWPKSAAMWERAKQSLGGGVSTGLRASMKPHPLFFDHGVGAELVDVDGNRYTDYVLGWGPSILGHANPELTQQVTEFAARGATFGAGHALEYEVAEAVVAAIPGMEKVLWSNTGSEANQIALRISRAVTGRNRFVKMMASYHGWSDTFLLGYRPNADGDLASVGTRGQSHQSLKDVEFCVFNDLDSVASVLRDPSKDVAALFVEPIICNSGVIVPDPGYLEGLRELCDETGTILVFDEVITGFRIAYGGAVEAFGVIPDMVVLGKAIAGGYSLAAVAGRADLIDETTRGVVHAGTYNGNPVVLAAAAATLKILGAPGVFTRLANLGEQLAEGFRSKLEETGEEGWVSQYGPVVQVALGNGLPTVEGFLQADQNRYNDITVELLKRGIFALPGGRWYLSTAHTEEHVADTLTAFGEALSATREHGPEVSASASGRHA